MKNTSHLDSSKIIFKYFPHLSQDQKDHFEKLGALYAHWNHQINVISRKDIDHFYEHHVLHALSIAKLVQFKPGTEIMDIGTGGGFPGIPLAILYPDAKFLLVDSIGNKIKVVRNISAILDLHNVEILHSRVEKVEGHFEFITARSVARLANIIPWIRNKISLNSFHNLPNGLLSLKGGDLKEELNEVRCRKRVYKLSNWFDNDFFQTKKLVHLSKIQPRMTYKTKLRV